MITYEEFKKLDIRIGKVVSAERIPDSLKLVKLMIDFGTEQRQILAGIAEFFPDLSVLPGKEMPFIINLEPRKMRGFESQGMMLAADTAGRPVLLHPGEDVPPGSIVK
jgi:methionine--tRNA ligase beta chain